MKKYLILLVVLLASYGVKAQCPYNLDAVDTSWANWQIFTGTVVSGSVGFPTFPTYSPTTPVSHLVVYKVGPGFASPNYYWSRDTMTGGSGLDPYGAQTGYYTIPYVCPFIPGNTHSLRIGDDKTGSQADRVRYVYHVPSSYTRFFAQFYYAFILNDGGSGHAYTDQPRFTISIIDSATGLPVPCNQFQFVIPNGGSAADSIFPSTTGTDVYYKRWTPATINLKNMQGRTIYFQFEATDCAFGGHFGYGYVDFTGCSQSIIQQIGCYAGSLTPSSDTLVGPKHASFADMRWYQRLPFTPANEFAGTANKDTIIIPPVITQDTVYVLITPLPGFGCLDTFMAIITPPTPPIAHFIYPQTYCNTSSLQFSDSSYTTTIGDYVNHWAWDFGDNTTSTLPNPVHNYVANGTYLVSLIISTKNGCMSDTDYATIVINRNPPLDTIGVSKDTICAPYTTTTISLLNSVPAGSTYFWTYTGLSLVSTTGGSITLKGNTVGHFPVHVHCVPPPGSTYCDFFGDTSIYVKGFEPPLFLDGVDSICLHDVTTINLSSKPANCGPSTTPCVGIPSSYPIGTNSSTTTGQPTPFYGFYTEQKMQMIYTAAELAAAGFNGGQISELAFEVLTKGSTAPYQNFNIKLACVPYSDFPTPSAFDVTTTKTVVYSNIAYNTFAGTNNFVFNVTPYDWDGVSNLLVEVCFDNGSSNFTQTDNVKKSNLGAGNNKCVYAFSDTDPLAGCDPLYDGNTMYPATFTSNPNDRPDITFKGCNAVLAPSVVITWGANPGPFSPITTTANSASVAPLVNTDYTVNASDNGCTNSQYFHVEQMTKNFIHASKDTSICKGASVALTVTGTGPAPAIPVPCSVNTTGGCTGTPLTAPVIGTGTQSTTYTPFDYANSNEHYLMRYTASSVLAAFGNVPGPKTITELDLNVLQKNTSLPIPNLTIRMQCVPTNYVFPTTSYPVGGLVVRSPSNYNTIVGWNNFTLTSPYNWDGVSDLLVEFCFNGGFDNTDSVQGTTMAGNCVLYGVNSGSITGCNITAPSAVSNSLPNIRFHYCNVSVNPSVLNYHWTSLHNSIPAGVNVDNDTIQMLVNKTDTFIVYLLGTSTNPFCPVKDTVVVTVSNALSTYPSHDTVVCKGNLVSLHNQLLTPGMTIDSIKWSTDYSANHLLTCKKCLVTTDSSYVSHHVYSTIITNLGCQKTDTIFIRNPILPTNLFTVTNPICLNTPNTITYTGNGTNAYTYNWNLDAGSNPASGILGQGPLTVSWNIAGAKHVKLTIDTIGCKVSSTDSVYVIPVLDATFTLSKHVICAGDSIQMLYAGTSNTIAGTLFTPSANGSTGVHGNNIAVSPITYTYATAGKYYLNLTVEYAGHLCPVTYVDSIEVYAIPSSNFTINKTDICSGDNVLVTYTGKTSVAGAAPQYAWNFANPSNIANGTVAVNMDTTLTYTNLSSSVAVKNVTLTVTQNGCVSTTTTHSVNVHVIPVAKIDVIEQLTCSGIDVHTNSNGSVVENVANANYIWTSTPLPTIPSSTTFSGLGQNGPFPLSFSNDTNLVKDYVMLQIIENGCTSNVAIDSVDVLPNPMASFRVIPDKICSGQTATFVFNGVIDTSCTTCTNIYTWTFPTGSNIQEPVPGTATVTFTNTDMFTMPNNGTLSVGQKHYLPNGTTQTCPSNNYTAPVMVHPLPKIDITGPVDICDKTTSYLSTSVNYVKYLWSDGSTNDTIKITHGGDYSVTVTDVNKCVSQALTHITVHPIPVANAGEDQLIFTGNAAFLNGSKSFGGDAYLWTPNKNIDAPTIVSPVVSPTETTPYILTYYNTAVGCVDYDTVIIKVRDCEPLVLPNAFTPNGDNIDDYFMVLNPNDYYRLVRLEIYNRWGELVYATNDKNNKGWDGQFRGVNQEVGTYIYHVTAECGGGKLMNVKGDVTLLR